MDLMIRTVAKCRNRMNRIFPISLMAVDRARVAGLRAPRQADGSYAADLSRVYEASQFIHARKDGVRYAPSRTPARPTMPPTPRGASSISRCSTSWSGASS